MSEVLRSSFANRIDPQCCVFHLENLQGPHEGFPRHPFIGQCTNDVSALTADLARIRYVTRILQVIIQVTLKIHWFDIEVTVNDPEPMCQGFIWSESSRPSGLKWGLGQASSHAVFSYAHRQTVISNRSTVRSIFTLRREM